MRAGFRAAVLGLALMGCSSGLGSGGYDVKDVDEALDRGAGVVLGEFPLRKGAVVDGDTIKVGGLDASLRLLGMDTEETFKSDKNRRAFERGWVEYLSESAAKTNRPVKIATPLGEEAKKFARTFFEGVQRVRLERDHPKELRGRFNRFLVYVFVEKEDVWVNYNVEAVRAGMSPYFTKYGYSRRFHDDFVEAQREAREKKLGIWAPDKMHYTDYDARLDWWNARAAFLQAFEQRAARRDDYVLLTNWDALRRLEARLGKDVTVIATVSDIRKSERGPTKVLLSRRMFSDVPVVFFDRYVFEDSRIEMYKGEYVQVRGRVNRWKNPHNGRSSLQILVNLASQVTVPTYTPPGTHLASKTAPKAPAPPSLPTATSSPPSLPSSSPSPPVVEEERKEP